MTRERRIGTRLGAYRIEDVVGRGGMGIVYLAEHVHLGRKVALKILAPELAADEAFQTRFIRECRIAGTIDHPNVIPVYDAGKVRGQLYIAMRYVEGSDLVRLLADEGRLHPRRAVALLEGVAGGLDAAHALGLVHRDVKPGNILIDRDDHPFLTDFGLTKRTDSRTAITGTGFVVGTTLYMAPEQLEGRTLDGRADQYALGCVLYECLAGEVPFARATEAATMFAHLRDTPPPLTDSRPDVSPALDAVIARALAKEPDERFETCTAFIAAARAALGGRAPAPAPPPRARPKAAPVRERAPRRRRRLPLVALAVLVAAGVVGVVLMLRSSPRVIDAGAPLDAGGPPAAPSITYHERGGDAFRVAPSADAKPENISDALKRLWGEGTDVFVNVSPDGRWIVAGTERPGCGADSCLVLLDADLKRAEVVKDAGEPVPVPVFAAVSSDGSLIAYAAPGGPHERDVFSLRRVGRRWQRPELLSDGSPYPFHALPGVSFDGTRIVFECGPDAHSGPGTALCESGSGGFRELVSPRARPGPPDNSLGHPRFAPDGSVVFRAAWEEPGDQIWRLAPGLGPTRVTRGRLIQIAPCVLGDGSMAVLDLNREGSKGVHEIRVIKADGVDGAYVVVDRDVSSDWLGCGGG